MAKFGVKEVCDVKIIDLVTEEVVLKMDTLKLSNLENAAENVQATGGKGNARLVSWDFNRTATFTVQDALMDPKALALQAGTTAVEGPAIVYAEETLVTIAGTTGTKLKVTLGTAPAANTKASVHKVDGTSLGALVEVVAGSGAPTTALEFTIGLSALVIGDKVIVVYQKTVTNATTVTISTNKFPGYYKVVGDTFVRNNKTGADEPYQVIIYKAKLLPGFTLTMEAAGDPSTFDFNMEVYKPDNSNDMVQLIKYPTA